MSQIVKDKNGNVLKTSDTEYHEDGTGPRDPSGILIEQQRDEAEVGGITQEEADRFKREILFPNLNRDASDTASKKSER